VVVGHFDTHGVCAFQFFLSCILLLRNDDGQHVHALSILSELHQVGGRRPRRQIDLQGFQFFLSCIEGQRGLLTTSPLDFQFFLSCILDRGDQRGVLALAPKSDFQFFLSCIRRAGRSAGAKQTSFQFFLSCIERYKHCRTGLCC